MKEQSNYEPGNADADMLDALKPGIDRVVAQLAHGFVRGQANVQLVGGSHFSHTLALHDVDSSRCRSKTAEK